MLIAARGSAASSSAITSADGPPPVSAGTSGRPPRRPRACVVQEPGAAFNRLASGRLDLAFIVNPEPDERVRSTPLLEDRWVILTRGDSELAAVPSRRSTSSTEPTSWPGRGAGPRSSRSSRSGANGAVEPSLTWIEPEEILIPRIVTLCHPRHRDPIASALTLMDAVPAQFGA